jgi:hypothetical protein
MQKNKFKQTIYKNETRAKTAKRNDILKNYEIGKPKRSYISIQTNRHTLSSLLQISPRDTIETDSPKEKSRNIVIRGKKSFQSAIQYTQTKEGTLTTMDSKISPRNGLNVSNTNLSHMLKIQKVIDKQQRKSIRDASLIKTAKLKEELLKEERNEEKDKVHENVFKLNKQRDFIKDFLKTKDSQLIKEGLLDKFYQVKENFVNFKNDCLIYPHIRNNFTVNESSDKQMLQLTSPNSIDTNTQLYLNLLKMKYQKIKDNNKIAQTYNKRDVIDEKIEDVYKKIYGNISKLVNIDTYDYNDYFNYKYDRYEKVYFSNKDVKTIVLNNASK